MTLPLALLCPILGFGVIFFVLVKLFRSLSQSNVNRGWVNRPPPSVLTSTADDGFWITSDQLAPSSMIQYYYLLNGVRQMGQVPFQPGPDGRQFIYTGARPDGVSVVLPDQGHTDPGDGFSTPPISSWSSTPRRSSPTPSTRFPPAY